MAPHRPLPRPAPQLRGTRPTGSTPSPCCGLRVFPLFPLTLEPLLCEPSNLRTSEPSNLPKNRFIDLRLSCPPCPQAAGRPSSRPAGRSTPLAGGTAPRARRGGRKSSHRAAGDRSAADARRCGRDSAGNLSRSDRHGGPGRRAGAAACRTLSTTPPPRGPRPPPARPGAASMCASAVWYPPAAMRGLLRDAGLILVAVLVLGTAANLVPGRHLAWWGKGHEPPATGVDFQLIDAGSADSMRTSPHDQKPSLRSGTCPARRRSPTPIFRSS